MHYYSYYNAYYAYGNAYYYAYCYAYYACYAYYDAYYAYYDAYYYAIVIGTAIFFAIICIVVSQGNLWWARSDSTFSLVVTWPCRLLEALLVFCFRRLIRREDQCNDNDNDNSNDNNDNDDNNDNSNANNNNDKNNNSVNNLELWTYHMNMESWSSY